MRGGNPSIIAERDLGGGAVRLLLPRNSRSIQAIGQTTIAIIHSAALLRCSLAILNLPVRGGGLAANRLIRLLKSLFVLDCSAVQIVPDIQQFLSGRGQSC